MTDDTTEWKSLGMDSLARLIERDDPRDRECREVALRTWRNRYKHEFPVYIQINGKLFRYEH